MERCHRPRTLEPRVDGVVEPVNFVPDQYVDSMLLLKIKPDEHGAIARYKARLVAKGYTQVEGRDYQETWAPTCRPKTLRCLLVAADVHNMVVHHIDIDCAFLNAALKEELYIRLPPDVGLHRFARLRPTSPGVKTPLTSSFVRAVTSISSTYTIRD